MFSLEIDLFHQRLCFWCFAVRGNELFERLRCSQTTWPLGRTFAYMFKTISPRGETAETCHCQSKTGFRGHVNISVGVQQISDGHLVLMGWRWAVQRDICFSLLWNQWGQKWGDVWTNTLHLLLSPLHFCAPSICQNFPVDLQLSSRRGTGSQSKIGNSVIHKMCLLEKSILWIFFFSFSF